MQENSEEKVIKINGNDVAQIREALDAAQKEQDRPTLIIGKTNVGGFLGGLISGNDAVVLVN